MAPNSAARASALAAVRFQIETWAPARVRAQTQARAEPPAPSTSARIPAGSAASAPSNPAASVFSASIRPPAKLSVFAAPISPAAAEARSAIASAASLCGTVTLTPANPSPGNERTRGSNRSGATSIAS